MIERKSGERNEESRRTSEGEPEGERVHSRETKVGRTRSGMLEEAGEERGANVTTERFDGDVRR